MMYNPVFTTGSYKYGVRCVRTNAHQIPLSKRSFDFAQHKSKVRFVNSSLCLSLSPENERATPQPLGRGVAFSPYCPNATDIIAVAMYTTNALRFFTNVHAARRGPGHVLPAVFGVARAAWARPAAASRSPYSWGRWLSSLSKPSRFRGSVLS